jgi:ABC-2 type transport system permease protein
MMGESLVSVFGGLILWISIFKNVQSVGDYSSGATITYFLLLPIVNFMTSTNIADDLGDQIRLGDFSNFIVKPLELWKTQFIKMVSEKIGFLLFVLPIYISILFIISRYFNIELGNIHSFILFLIFTVVGMILNFLIDMMIVPLAFWFDEVWSFKHLKKILGLFLGGMAFPITIATGFYRQLIDFSPFKYVTYVPVAFLTGKLGYDDLIYSLVQLSIWVVVFILLGRIIFYFGIKNYSANGN